MSQPTDVTGVPEEEGRVDTTGLEEFDEDDALEEEGPVDTTGEEEVDEEEDPLEGEEEPEEGEDATQLAALRADVSRKEVLRRGRSWIKERVMYSQSGYHSNRYGRYRRDCSGYVSMCWLLDRSYTTATIMQVAHRIPRNQLRPGDALWRRRAGRGHMALFVGRNDKGLAVVYEEYRTGRPCERRVWSRKRELDFTPIRLSGSGGTPGRPLLKRGSSGSAVKELQRMLRIEVDGDFGPATERAVKAFQTRRGLSADGICGPATWAALDAVRG